MFGLWYITFVFVAIGISLLVCNETIKKRKKYYVKKINYNKQQIKDIYRSDKSWIQKEEKVEELENENEKFAVALKKSEENDYDIIVSVFAIVCSTVSVVLCIISFLLPITAQNEVNYYIQQKEYVELAIENGEALENIAITQIVIENNEWLAQAKASKLTYGCFSRFYNIDLSELEPITIQRK